MAQNHPSCNLEEDKLRSASQRLKATMRHVKTVAALNLPAHRCGLASRAARVELNRNNGGFYTRLSSPPPRRPAFIVSSGENMSPAAGDGNLYSSLRNNQWLRNEKPVLPLRPLDVH